MDSENNRVVIALAGRRVDPPGAEHRRFPPENADAVKIRIARFFEEQVAAALVSSAACGVDLLAQEVAQERKMRRLVVLPFSKEVFRRKSVVDRPGDWGERYDRAIEDIEIVIWEHDHKDPKAYLDVNHAILDQAAAIGLETKTRVAAVVVWDGQSRGPGDITEAFAKEAEKRGIQVLSLSTL